MTCNEIAPGVNICRPTVERKRLVKTACDNCGCDRWHAVFVYEWYDPSGTCLRCGERWEGDEYLPRPFCPGWRQDNIASAKRRWRADP